MLSDYFAIANNFDDGNYDESSMRSDFETKLNSLLEELRVDDDLPSSLRAIRHAVPFLYVKKLKNDFKTDKVQVEIVVKQLCDNYIDFMNDFRTKKFKDLIQLNQILLKDI